MQESMSPLSRYGWATFKGTRNRHRMSLPGPVIGVRVGPSAYCAPHGYLRRTPTPELRVKALRVELTDTLAYWTVVASPV
jgi:hypothetical protein